MKSSNSFQPKTIMEISQAASKFQSTIRVRVGRDRTVDAKSILGLLCTITPHERCEIQAYGPDQQEAKEELKKIFISYGLHVS